MATPTARTRYAWTQAESGGMEAEIDPIRLVLASPHDPACACGAHGDGIDTHPLAWELIGELFSTRVRFRDVYEEGEFYGTEVSLVGTDIVSGDSAELNVHADSLNRLINVLEAAKRMLNERGRRWLPARSQESA